MPIAAPELAIRARYRRELGSDHAALYRIQSKLSYGGPPLPSSFSSPASSDLGRFPWYSYTSLAYMIWLIIAFFEESNGHVSHDE